MKNLILVSLSLFILGCSSGTTSTDTDDGAVVNNSGWLIPQDEVLDGGPGKDGIPSIDQPKFTSTSQVNFLEDNDLVVGIIKNGVVKAYPHKILDYHEVVNDVVGDFPVTISYCPLTGTAFGWSSVADGGLSTFGVSGLIYKANLILYDRATDSNWSQLGMQCVNGSQLGQRPVLESVVETDWATWKKMYPTSAVLNLNTGFDRNYDEYPYGPYKTEQAYFIFRAYPTNEALPNKERIYALIHNEKAKVYQFDKFEGGKIFKESFEGAAFLVAGNEHIISSFQLNPEQENLTFEYLGPQDGAFFKDSNENFYTALGTVIAGPNKGETLHASTNVVSYWFALAAYYPNPVIY